MSLKGHDFRSTKKIQKKPSTLKQKTNKNEITKILCCKKKTAPKLRTLF